MAEDDDAENPKPVKVEVLPPEEVVPVGERASRFPFVNRWFRRSVESQTVLIQSLTRLKASVIDHAKTEFRLRDVEVEIEADHYERVARAEAARSEAELSHLKHQVKKKELERDLARLAREEAAEGPAPPKSPPPPRKNPVDRVLELKKEWEAAQHRLRQAGLSETDEEWIVLQNRYEAEIQRLRDQ